MMGAIVKHSNLMCHKRLKFTRDHGFTLVEAMISLVILAVILLGLQTGLITAITMNAENLLRNEAVELAQERMDQYRTMPGDPDVTESFTRQVRNFNVTYTIINNYDSSTNVLNMSVEWKFKGEDHSLEYTSHIGG